DRWILGIFAHATHFVLLPALAGAAVLLDALDAKHRLRLVMAGVLFGAAVLMKQQAIFFLMFGVGLVAATEMKAGGGDLSRAAVNCTWLVIGAAVPFAIISLLLYAQGVLGNFWFWTIQYATEYVTEVPLSRGWQLFSEGWTNITRESYWLWI